MWSKLALYVLFLVLSVRYESIPRDSCAADTWAAWAIWLLALVSGLLSFVLIPPADPDRGLLVGLALIVIWRVSPVLARWMRRRVVSQG